MLKIGVEGWQSGLMRRTRNAVGSNPSEVQILYPPPRPRGDDSFFGGFEAVPISLARHLKFQNTIDRQNNSSTQKTPCHFSNC